MPCCCCHAIDEEILRCWLLPLLTAIDIFFSVFITISAILLMLLPPMPAAFRERARQLTPRRFSSRLPCCCHYAFHTPYAAAAMMPPAAAPLRIADCYFRYAMLRLRTPDAMSLVD